MKNFILLSLAILTMSVASAQEMELKNYNFEVTSVSNQNKKDTAVQHYDRIKLSPRSGSIVISYSDKADQVYKFKKGDMMSTYPSNRIIYADYQDKTYVFTFVAMGKDLYYLNLECRKLKIDKVIRMKEIK